MAFNPGLKHLTTRLDGGVVWSANTSYLADNVVIFADASYRCMVNHTSAASFSTDLLAGRWVKLSADAINYILNSNPIVDTSGWSTYLNTASSQPVNGSGAGATVQWQRSTTTPLRGIADFNFVKTAVNSQGQGVSTDFTIDLADQAKVLTVTFDYEVLSGTYADGDLTVYLIADPTGTPVIIQPAGYVVQNATVGTKMKQIATFQTQATGQSYRLCFHVASVSALAYTLAIDNVVVGPQVVQYGSPVTDWVSFTPTLNSSTGVATNTAKRRRVGDSLEVEGQVSFNAQGANSTFTVAIPDLSIDTAKLSASTTGTIGNGYWSDAGTGFFDLTARPNSTNVAFYQTSGVGSFNTTVTANGDVLSYRFLVPISGWSSTVQMSNDTDTRVVATKAASLVAISVANGGETAITMPSVAYDTHSGWTSSTEYTIPVSGYYRVTQIVGYTTGTWGGGSFWYVNLLKGGVFEARLITEVYANADTTSGLSGTKTGSATAFYNAGQKLSVIVGQANSAAVSKSFTGGIWVERVSGPSAIAASETVRARVVMSANQSFGISVFYPNLNVKTYDSHNAMSSSGVFTAPISGVYSVKMSLGSDGTATFPTTQGFDIGIEKNGTTLISQLGISYGNGTTNINQVIGSDSIYLNAGETIRMRCSSGVAFTASASFRTFFAVERVGN